jgi:ligand-binding sensor domain-containing protein
VVPTASRAARATLAALAILHGAAPAAAAQTPPSRLWRAEERTFITDLWRVTAVAATSAVLYAATPNGLAVYDRAFLSLRDVLGAMDGFPLTPVTAMAADPADDTAWLGAAGLWVAYEPQARRFESGALPGTVSEVALDARDPSRGAYFRTSAGWYFVPRGGLTAEPAMAVPPPAARIGQLTAEELRRRAPALDVARMRLERDDQLRSFVMTSAALAPVSTDLFIGTSGNGVFRVDPLTYSADRYPAGLVGASVGALAMGQGQVCAGSEANAGSRRHGITCFREDLANPSYFEGRGLAELPGTWIRRLLVTRRALWAATDAGLLRVDRSSGALQQLLMRDGLPSDDVRALAPAPDGIWVGTTRGIAAVVEQDNRRATVATAIAGNATLALAARGDTLWLGTVAGLAVLLPGERAPLAVMGHPELRDPIVALALLRDTVVAATEARLLLGADSGWRVVDPAGPSIGRLVALAADTGGLWVAGSNGLAFFKPTDGFWTALTAQGDIPQPVRDVAVTRNHVWVATQQGVVRYLKRVLVP